MVGAHGVFSYCAWDPLAAACRIFLVMAHELSVAACGIQLPNQGLSLSPLHGENGAPATGPQGKSQGWINHYCLNLTQRFWIDCSVGFQIRSDQSLSRVWLFATPWIAARQASLSITNSQSSLRLTSIESVMSSSHRILCHSLLLLPPIPPSIRVFSNESTLCMRWPKYWGFGFSIIPSKEIPGLISFRMDWLDLLVVQGTLKSLLQHHSSKASILRRSAFFTVQLSNPYLTTGKTIPLTRRTFIGKVKTPYSQNILRLF